MTKQHPRANQSSHTRDRSVRKRPAHQTKPGQRAHTAGVQLLSYEVGALPLVNRVLDRMHLETILLAHLPKDDPRTELPTVRALLVLIANLLLSREPVYGVGDWATHFPPGLLGLRAKDLPLLHDDRFGRSLDRMFDGIGPALVMAVVRHVVQEFAVSLDELHNDSTTVSFYGAYKDAAEEAQQRGRPTIAITWGHSKARRPDLKQLLYILTITDDGGVPVHFSTASGNVVDDHTHIATWDLLRQLVGHPDFLYVADCKLANSEDMSHIATRGGRFVTVLPRGRTEDLGFRARLHESPSPVIWQDLYKKVDKHGHVVDAFSVCDGDHFHSDGYRLFWYHSTRKAQLDVETRSRKISQAAAELGDLNARLLGPRTRFRERSKVEQAVESILTDHDVSALVSVHIEEREEATFRQATRGRPSKKTKYVKATRSSYKLTWELNLEGLSYAEREDGVFPLVTNDRSLVALEALQAYKRQPLIEKRFSQFKTDFAVAPVYLKNVGRIQGLLAAYFFVLMAQTLLERELRQGMARVGLKSIPLYPESRQCARPTTHRVIELFSPIQRHEVSVEGEEPQIMVTELTDTQKKIIRMLGMDPKTYGY
jgi:transposase